MRLKEILPLKVWSIEGGKVAEQPYSFPERQESEEENKVVFVLAQVKYIC